MEIRGIKVDTLADLMENVIDRINDPDEAKAFMEEYRNVTEFADANMGAVSLYYSDEYRYKLVDRFGIREPEYWKTQTAGDSYNSGFLDGQLHMAKLLSKKHGIQITYIEMPVLKKRVVANGELENVGSNRSLADEI